MNSNKLLALCICLAVIFIFIGLMPVHGEAEIYDSVVRLHVLANSDSEEDQALKLKVRDAVLKASAGIINGCSEISEAEKCISDNIDVIRNTALDCVRENGYDYNVTVDLGEEVYPTKKYESFCFPSGKYLSLRVMIGEAEGQNWWCVLFPPLCLSAATARSAEDSFVSVGLSADQYKIITESDTTKYTVRFKILEAFEGALS